MALEQVIKEFGDKFEAKQKEFVESQKAVESQIKELGEARTEDLKKRDALESELQSFAGELKSLQEKFGQYEAKGKFVPYGRDGDEEVSIGERFVKSDAYKRMIENNDEKSAPMKLKSFFQKDETLYTGGGSGESNLIEPFRRPDLVIKPDRMLRIRDLMTVMTTSTNAIEYVRETGYAPLQTSLSAAIVATDTDFTVDNAQGFYAGQKITVDGVAKVVDTVDYDTNTVAVTVAFAAGHAVGDKVKATYFGATPELELKPESGITFDLQTESVKTLAHGIPASRQVLADAAQLAGRINNRLAFGLKQNEEEHILYGDGTSRMLSGILMDADRQQYAWSDGETGDTKIDAIRRALTLARLAEYPVNGIVMHPNDWEDIALAKGSDSHYIWISVQEGGTQRLWALPVVDTTAIAEGTALVGGFGLGSTLWDREEANIRIADQHKDYFQRNMVFILGEERLCQTIERPEAFVEVSFDNAPA